MAYGFRDDFDWEHRWELKTKIKDYLISTVDLGIDHSFGFGEPLYYETMIFKISDGTICCTMDYQERYSTKEEAIIGHQKAVEYVKSGDVERENTTD